MKWTHGFAAAGLFLAWATLAVSAAQAREKSRLDEVLARGKLIVGVTSEGPPFGFVDDKESWSASTSISRA